MTLKNWTAVAKSLKYGEKGFLNYLYYLKDQRRHRDQEIEELLDHDNPKRILRQVNELEINRHFTKQQYKGGRPANYGWSVILSYPFQVPPAELKKLLLEITIKFYQYVNEENDLNLKDEEIRDQAHNYVVAVSHRGEKINNHMHLIFGKHLIKRSKGFLSESKEIVSVDLTKKKYTRMLKNINDQVVEDILQITKSDYIIKSHHKQKRRKSIATTKRMSLDIKLSEVQKEREELHSMTREYEAKLEAIEKEYQEAVELSKGLKEKTAEFKEYAQERFKKDLELHRDYMSKGMTIKAEKLEAKIERKIQKFNPTPGL